MRSGKDGKRTIVGHAATFDDWYDVGDPLSWGWKERIARGAFDGRTDDDVLMLVNHDDDGVPLGRTTAGTLRLTVDDRGLHYENDPPESAAREVEAVARGDMPYASFSFEALEEEWRFGAEGEPDERTIKKFRRLWDVSIVSLPANMNADAAVRKRNVAKQEREAVVARRKRRLRLLELQR